jgi:hypothetical protein
MPENENHIPPVDSSSGHLPNGTERFRTLPNDSATFGNVPKASEPFRTIPNDAESFRTFPKPSERKENHTLTVRESARLFEAARVARTERSITNWCQPNRTGVARLDSYYDPNERKYYISPQSVDLAIAEEKAKAAKNNEPAESFGKVPQDSEGFRTVPHDVETGHKHEPSSEGDANRLKELERENLDLKITNRAKDMAMEQMGKERENFFNQLLTATHKLGELETKLMQLEGPKNQGL